MARFLVWQKHDYPRELKVHDHGVLYQHIPRTGGSWIEKAIQVMDVKAIRWLKKQAPWLPSKHALLSHYRRPEMARVHRVWTAVRHPIPYYESVWKWLSRPGRDPGTWRGAAWHPHASAARWFRECPDGKFDDWVFLMLKKEPLWYTRIIEQYIGPPGGEFCDFIGRTSSLSADFFHVMMLFGFGREALAAKDEILALGRVNATDSEPLEWSDDLKAEVLETERPVVERFYDDNIGRRLYAGLAPENAEKMAGIRPD